MSLITLILINIAIIIGLSLLMGVLGFIFRVIDDAKAYLGIFFMVTTFGLSFLISIFIWCVGLAIYLG